MTYCCGPRDGARSNLRQPDGLSARGHQNRHSEGDSDGTPANCSDVLSTAIVGSAPPCVTVKVWPATVNVAVRSGPVFGPTVYVTEPFDDPDPFTGVSHDGALLTTLTDRSLSP